MRAEILDHLYHLLLDATPAGPSVFLARVTPMPKSLSRAVHILPLADKVVGRASALQTRELEVEIQILARGENLHQSLDAIYEAVRAAIAADATLGMRLAGTAREEDSDWDFDTGETDTGVLTVSYILPYRR